MEDSRPASIMIGSKLSRYWIVDKLGEGGMGVVYKARDEQLLRFVAIKLLKGSARDPRRIPVLEREARAASSLSHPNIITVHDIELTVSDPFIVFEYIDGQSLAKAIPPEGMDTDAVVRYATQIASALVAASGVGLVHRDLKPSNIMLTRSGIVKVLDFGLAGLNQSDLRPLAPDSRMIGTDDATLVQEIPGESSRVIAGTPAYMAPEVAVGQKADARSDIYALGAVIFKMATGCEFVAGAELKGREHALRAVPARLRRQVTRCLEADPARRYQTATQLFEDLNRVGPSRITHRLRWAGLAAAALLTMVGFAAFRYFNPAEIGPPDRPEPLTSYPGRQVGTSFSPDGGSIAFAWDGGAGTVLDIYTQRVGGTGYRRLTHSLRRSYNPAWSPDGKWIAFLNATGTSQAALTITPASGGRERVVANLAAAPYLDSTALDWSPDSRWIVYGDPDSSQKKAIWAVMPESGERRLLIAPGPKDGYFTQPAISPDGRMIVFVEEYFGVSRLRLGNLGPDLRLQGETVRLHLRGFDSFDPAGPRWMADTRTILFSSHGNGFERALWYVDLKGGRGDPEPKELVSGSELSDHPVVSRDGSMIAFTQRIMDENVWRIPLRPAAGTQAAPVKLLGSTRQEKNARYSPDGTRIAFESDRNGLPQIWISDADGNNSFALTQFHSFLYSTPQWSRDGRRLVFEESDGGRPAIYIVDAHRGAAPRLVAGGDRSFVEPSFCEGDRAVYYVDNTTGILEIRRSPVAGGASRRIRGGDSDLPMCSADGRYLYYVTPENGTGPDCLMRMIMPDGPSQLVVRNVDFGYPMGDRIYCRRNSGAPAVSDIFSVDVAGNGSRHEALIAGKTTGLSISPDGKYALVSMVDRDTSTLVMLRRRH